MPIPLGNRPESDPEETSNMASYDVIIIGAGPGGYVCAIRLAAPA